MRAVLMVLLLALLVAPAHAAWTPPGDAPLRDAVFASDGAGRVGAFGADTRGRLALRFRAGSKRRFGTTRVLGRASGLNAPVRASAATLPALALGADGSLLAVWSDRRRTSLGTFLVQPDGLVFADGGILRGGPRDGLTPIVSPEAAAVLTRRGATLDASAPLGTRGRVLTRNADCGFSLGFSAAGDLVVAWGEGSPATRVAAASGPVGQRLRPVAPLFAGPDLGCPAISIGRFGALATWTALPEPDRRQIVAADTGGEPQVVDAVTRDLTPIGGDFTALALDTTADGAAAVAYTRLFPDATEELRVATRAGPGPFREPVVLGLRVDGQAVDEPVVLTISAERALVAWVARRGGPAGGGSSGRGVLRAAELDLATGAAGPVETLDASGPGGRVEAVRPTFVAPGRALLAWRVVREGRSGVQRFAEYGAS